VTLTTIQLAPSLKKMLSYTSLPLWYLVAVSRVKYSFTFTVNMYDLYERPLLVKRCRALRIAEEVKTLRERATVDCDKYVAYVVRTIRRISG
jgi:hypothetical protein